MQSAIWHSWEFGGWYRRVPYGTLGRERVKSFKGQAKLTLLLFFYYKFWPGAGG